MLDVGFPNTDDIKMNVLEPSPTEAVEEGVRGLTIQSCILIVARATRPHLTANNCNAGRWPASSATAAQISHQVQLGGNNVGIVLMQEKRR
jgi:hypothetical protein